MTVRIALDTIDDSKPADGSFSPCAFAAGATSEAPACSAALVLATVREQFERESVRGVCDTGRYRMRYRMWGQGPALFIVPGLCDDSETFILPMARLSQKFCCITYDMPTGDGDGAQLAKMSHANLVADLFALADHLRIHSAIVEGVSFGSTVALAALAKAPERFTVGILQGGFAQRPLAWTEVLLADFARFWKGPIVKLPLWRAVIEHLYGRDFAELEPLRWPYFLQHHGSAPMAAVARRALILNSIDLRPILASIRQPVLMICGDRDPLVGRTCEEVLRAGLPNVARAEIESCGHLPHFTHPEVLCEVIEQFMGLKDGES